MKRGQKMEKEFIEVGEYRVRLMPSLFEISFYAVVQGLVDAINHLYFRVEIFGRDKIPAPPFILAPTHRSNLDTLLISSLSRKRLRFMGKDSLWKNRFAGNMLSALGGFPVKREIADRAAVDSCVRVLRAGQSLVLFPEGMRKDGSSVAEILDGAAYIAIKAGVPIIPIGISGSDRAMAKGVKVPRPKRVVMMVGDPILNATVEGDGRISRSKIKELTLKLQDDLQEVFNQAQMKL